MFDGKGCQSKNQLSYHILLFFFVHKITMTPKENLHSKKLKRRSKCQCYYMSNENSESIMRNMVVTCMIANNYDILYHQT